MRSGNPIGFSRQIDWFGEEAGWQLRITDRLLGASKSGATPCQKLRVNFGKGESSWTLAGCARDLSRQKSKESYPSRSK
jgi:hypothetical protein